MSHYAALYAIVFMIGFVCLFDLRHRRLRLLPDSQPCRLLTVLQMLFGSFWCKKICAPHLIPDNGPTHAPKQIKKWIRSLN